MGLEGLLSELKVLNIDRLSGNGGAFPLLANVVPPPLGRCRRMALAVIWSRGNRIRSNLARVAKSVRGHFGACLCSRESPSLLGQWRRMQSRVCCFPNWTNGPTEDGRSSLVRFQRYFHACRGWFVAEARECHLNGGLIWQSSGQI